MEDKEKCYSSLLVKYGGVDIISIYPPYSVYKLYYAINSLSVNEDICIDIEETPPKIISDIIDKVIDYCKKKELKVYFNHLGSDYGPVCLVITKHKDNSISMGIYHCGHAKKFVTKFNTDKDKEKYE